MPAAHTNGELTAGHLREIVIFLSHYAGWQNGARLNTIAKAARKA